MFDFFKILFISTFIIFGHKLPVYAQTKSYIQIKGSFYDDSTGLDIPTKVYSVKKGQRKYMGQSEPQEPYGHIFNFKIDLETDSLEFESPGYHSKVFPIHYFGQFLKPVLLNLGIKTLKATNVNPESITHYCLGSPLGELAKDYSIIHYFGEKFHCEQKIGGPRLNIERSNYQQDISNYILKITTPNDEIYKTKFVVLPGLNIIDANYYYQPNQTEKNNPSNTVPDTTEPEPDEPSELINTPDIFEGKETINLFFAQSKYNLRTKALETINEICEYLKNNPDVELNIVGYTDGVGDKSLNKKLAEYRAKVVSQMFIRKGISPERLSVSWKSEEELMKSHTDLEILRKVTISKK